jgi:D-tyrosyl-tRNA(Tyr) deacylase
MRAILQRVASAAVTVDRETVGAIGAGMLVLVGVERGDNEASAAILVEKVASVRIFADEAGKMNFDASRAGAAFLVVSQFTLAGSLARGRRPSFNRAAPPEIARTLVDAVANGLAARGFTTATGRFGAHMTVSLVNDGPVTFVLDVPVPGTSSTPEAAEGA